MTSKALQALLVSLLVLSLVATALVTLEAALNGDLGRWEVDLAEHATLAVSVLLVLYAATFLAYWRPRRLQARPFALVAAIGLALVSGALGLASYWGCQDDGEALLWTPVHDTLALFLGSVRDPSEASAACPDSVPVALQAARLTALLATLTTVVAAIVRVFRDQWDRLSVRFARSVVVVVGLDRDSMRILEVLARDPDVPQMVVGVDQEPGSPHVSEARSFGARVLLGSAADQSWLRTLSHPTIRAAYLLSPRPEENLAWFDDIEALARRRAAGKSRWRESSRVIVRIDDRWEADHWRRAHVLQAGGVLLDTIGVLQVTAQELIGHAIGRGVEALVLLGNTPLAAAVVDELAQHWREQATLASARRFSVILVDPEAESLAADHVFHERSFGNDPLPATTVAEAPTVDTVVAAVAAATDRPQGCSVVVLDCREPTVSTFRSAQRISAAQPSWQVLARRVGSRGIDQRPILPNLVPYGPTLVTRDGVPEDGWTRIARRLHTEYREGDGDPDDPARRPWDELDEFYRVSNLRQVALTLLIAERAGRTWDPGDGSRRPSPLTRDEIAALAHLEHEDWRAYYLAHGWTLGERGSGPRRSPYLKPWADLSPEEAEATIRGVVNSLEQLTTLGYHPFDAGTARAPTSPPARFVRRGAVTARRRDEPWTWTTASGDELAAEAGDWHVVADDGREWSVNDQAFRATYRHLEGDRWERQGVVTAREATGPEQVATAEGASTANPGDWVVEDDEQHRWVVPQARFRDSYSPVEDDGRPG